MSEARQFTIETAQCNNRSVTFVSIESNHLDNREITPEDWREQTLPHIESADLLFTNYFMPELDRTIMNKVVLGKITRRYADQYLQAYDWLATAAEQTRTPVATAEIANRVSYLHYEVRDWLCVATQTGHLSPTPGHLEKILPSPTEARRMFTAAGLYRAACSLEEGAKLTYIAAPAHVKRIQRFVTQPLTPLERARARMYNQSFGELDKSLRVYEHGSKGWERTHTEPLRLGRAFKRKEVV